MRRGTLQHHMDALVALLLFGIFAACVLAVLLTGASAYRRLTQRDQASYEYRTLCQYITTRVRQADQRDGIAVGDFGGVDALMLFDESGYITYVYCYGGYLMELYTSADSGLIPQDGEKLMEASGLELSLEDGLLKVDVAGTERETLYLSLRSGEGAAA